MLRAAVRLTDRRYLAPLTRLEELTVICKDPADYGNRRTGIKKRPHWTRSGVFPPDSKPSFNNVTRIHHRDVDARAGIGLVEGIPIEFDVRHLAMTRNILVRSSIPALRGNLDELQTAGASLEGLCVGAEKFFNDDITLDRDILSGVRMRPLLAVLFKHRELCREGGR